MKVTKETFDRLCKLTHAMLTDDGKEINNPMPLAIPSELNRPLTLQEQIARVLNVVSAEAKEQGLESYKDSMDFDIVDPFDFDQYFSKYELVEDEWPWREHKGEKVDKVEVKEDEKVDEINSEEGEVKNASE